MTEARMSDDLAQSGRPKGGNPRGVARDLLHLLAEIGAAVTGYFRRPPPASDLTFENRGENGLGKARLVSRPVEEASVKPSVTESPPSERVPRWKPPEIVNRTNCSSMPDPDLIRFLDAQDEIYDQVIAELATGGSGATGCGSFSRNLLALGEVP